MSMIKLLENDKFATFAKGSAGTVIAMTAVKAIARPAFIYTDKKSDAETKKYAASKEFLYQVLCLGITFALLPIFKSGAFKLAEKHLNSEPLLKDISEKMSKTSFFNKANSFKNELEQMDRTKLSEEASKKVNLLKGSIEAGAFVGSVGGLTILAPWISDIVLHPIMRSLGLEKKKKNDIGQPGEIFLADAKVPTEKETRSKLDKNV